MLVIRESGVSVPLPFKQPTETRKKKKKSSAWLQFNRREIVWPCGVLFDSAALSLIRPAPCGSVAFWAAGGLSPTLLPANAATIDQSRCDWASRYNIHDLIIQVRAAGFNEWFNLLSGAIKGSQVNFSGNLFFLCVSTHRSTSQKPPPFPWAGEWDGIPAWQGALAHMHGHTHSHTHLNEVLLTL